MIDQQKFFVEFPNQISVDNELIQSAMISPIHSKCQTDKFFVLTFYIDAITKVNGLIENLFDAKLHIRDTENNDVYIMHLKDCEFMDSDNISFSKTSLDMKTFRMSFKVKDSVIEEIKNN